MRNLVVNLYSRDITFDYISEILIFNENRCKMGVDERTIAGDGFMLNLLSALQALSLEVIAEIFTKFFQSFYIRL